MVKPHKYPYNLRPFHVLSLSWRLNGSQPEAVLSDLRGRYGRNNCCISRIFIFFSVQAETRQYKLLKAKETRNNCTYCSVGCGMLMYSLGDNAKNVRESIYHVEGDADHPVSRGSLCPKGAGVLDYIHSENRLQYPEYRAPGSDKWQRISWDDAIERIARLMKQDRDANFIEKNAQA